MAEKTAVHRRADGGGGAALGVWPRTP